ncbi:hypothetical protein T484DRAFT_1861652 [Baffinella frigidus]|nr:hypothetical protein T484DRAFT_1861652 [Cryptophyta sp. CCMP2293]
MDLREDETVHQTTYAFARRAGTLARISEWDRFALLAAALCHDLEHPGVSSPFIAKAGAVFSGAFKDVLLEKHHALRAFEAMVDRDVGLFESLSTAQYSTFRTTVADCLAKTVCDSLVLRRRSVTVVSCEDSQ